MFTNILNFRVLISLVLVAIVCITMLSFYLRKNLILKMSDLAFVYISTIIFLMYLIVIKKVEDTLFPILIIIFIDLLLTFLAGIAILNNLLKRGGEEDV